MTDPRILYVYVEPGDSPAELITELYLILSAMYESFGGSGLKILEDNDDAHR